MVILVTIREYYITKATLQSYERGEYLIAEGVIEDYDTSFADSRNGPDHFSVNSVDFDITGSGIGYLYRQRDGCLLYTSNSSWKDLLTKVGNQEISYDNQGNPITYLGHTLTWEKGRQLKSFGGNSYTYNANGIRTSKTVNGIVHNYTLEGTKILKEVWGNNILVPLYDNEEILCGIEYNGNTFYFVRNLQNDIITLTDKDGETVARYTYDTWGVCTVAEDTSEIGIAAINPYRYKSYYRCV